jgi:two-component system, LytTR family, sensor kinase
MKLLFSLIQVMSFFLFIAYVYCNSPGFCLRREDRLRFPNWFILYVFFSAISIGGTYLGMPVQGAVANIRALGPVLAGLVGGPLLGTAVGLTGGIHRYFYGGFTAFACGLSTTVEGLVGGLVYFYMVRRSTPERSLNPSTAFLTMVAAETLQMAIILLTAKPFPEALRLVQIIALPMIIANSAGAALFMRILQDRRNVYDQVGAISTARALRIAGRTLSILAKGFTREAAPELARIIQEETGVGAVAITDTDHVLAFVGLGSDHHATGAGLGEECRRTITHGEVLFLDGIHETFRCTHAEKCPLGSVLVIPLRVDSDVIGTIKLFEPARKRFLRMNRTLGEGLAELLASQLLRSRYQEQKNLLVLAELKLARAQINPHFLFNSLTTIQAILRKDSDRARALLNHLSSFFRMNLKRSPEYSTLEEELAHVRSYLEIEKARFEEQLSVEIDVDPSLFQVKLPTFTLQPLLENAIKHGIADKLEPGVARIRAYWEDGAACIDVEDDAGTYLEKKEGTLTGLGLGIVDKRIQNMLQSGSGLSISCVPNELTRVSIRIPEARAAA